MLITTVVVAATVLASYWHVSNYHRGATSSERYIYVNTVDTLDVPIIITESFKDLMLCKVSERYGNNMLYSKDTTAALPRSVGHPHTSPYIERNYRNIPDTIFATGYYVKSIAELKMMVDYDGRNIRIMSYRYKINHQ